MTFCTNCGGALFGEARFCSNCGKPVAGGVPRGPSVAVAPAPEPLDYKIEDDNLQVARVPLKPGQELYAEAGKMVYKTPNVLWDTRMSGSTFGEKIWGAIKRKLMGESLFLTYFKTIGGDGEVGFAGSYPGRIQVFDLAAGKSVLVESDSFLFAQSSAQLNIALVKKLGTGFFGGEGFILEKLTGPGRVGSLSRA